MTGGTASQALDAASNALTCLMGLVCDPVGGLVEIPCQKRNATAALTALASAQIALAGVANLVGFDETVAAMDAVGRTLPFELRESALGGIAATPSACAWCAGARITHREAYTLARSDDDGRTRRGDSSESRASRSSRWARNPSEAFGLAVFANLTCRVSPSTLVTLPRPNVL